MIYGYFTDTSSGVLTEILSLFNWMLKQGADTVADAGSKLALALLILQWFKAVALMGLSRQHITQAMLYVVGAGVWYEATTNIVSIADSFINFMSGLGGAITGNNDLTMTNPSSIFAVALKVAKSVADVASHMSFLDEGFTIIILVFFIASILVMCTILGTIAIIAVVQGYIDLIVAVALMPFAVEPGTRFLATPGIGKIMAAGGSLGAVSVVVGAGVGLMQQFAVSLPEDNVQAVRYAANNFCASLVIALMAGITLFMSRAGISKITSSASMVFR